MQPLQQLSETRRTLIKLVKGGTQYYHIEYSVDIKGNITIWGGEKLGEHMEHDMFMFRTTEFDLHLYDGWRHGGELCRMEREAAKNITRDELIQAFTQFRQQHPRDGYGMLHEIAQHWCGAEKDDLKGKRNDEEEVQQELRRRNRQYIAELYGEHLPVDFDFRADYDRRMATR